MKKHYFFFLIFCGIFFSCIREEAPNPEADLLVLSFPENSLRTEGVEIYNDYVTVYPRPKVNLRDSAITALEVSAGATWERIESPTGGEVLFYIQVTSESREYTKRYSIIEVGSFSESFHFENWVRPSSVYLYENPKEGSLLWYSSNNGAAIAWNNSTKPPNEYLVRKISFNGNTAAEMRTMEGPGKIAGGITFIPCLAGSLYLGGFNALTGLTAPLKSTLFGVPFDNGKPTRFSGRYIFKHSSEDYINSDGTREKGKKDICAVYAVLFKTDEKVQFLYGDDIDSSPNVIARAEIKPTDFVEKSDFTFFDIEFDYNGYSTPFSWAELKNNEYKISLVFSSSSRGQYYEGCPGNTLVVDDIEVQYQLAE